MIPRSRGSKVGTCMEIDLSSLFTSEGRRSRSGLLGDSSRNVGEEFRERAVGLWRKIKRKRPRGPREYGWLLLVNAMVMGLVFFTGIVTYESSVDELRHSLESTVLFPIYLPHAVALSIASKLKWQAIMGILFGLYASRTYTALRGKYLFSLTRGAVLLAVAVLGTAEVYSANYFLYRQLMKEGTRKKLPTIESVKEALMYLGIVVVCTLFFDTIISLVICTSPLVLWSDCYRFWGTSWLGVLSGMLTISPAITHLLAWQPRPSLLLPKKLLEAVGLTVLTGTLVVIIFVTNSQSVIYPLPYLLFPVIILTAFRFNRLGCSLVVAVIAYVCTWASVRGKGAMYRMSGSPVPISSPKLILQTELFVSVVGLVGILLAAAVREKKQLAGDLHKMNEELESTVSERTIELVKANEALRESQRKAELANQAKSDFLANMSHEIRTPIHGIMGLTSLVLDTELSPDQRDSLLSVQDCANVLLHIINSILDLAKIEAGRIEVEFVHFRVSQLVSSTVRMLHTRAKAKNLDLVWDIDPSVPLCLVGDSGKLQQCLLNLIGNAVKFTHQGSVRVHVRVDKGGGSGNGLSARHAAEEQAPSSGSASPCVPTFKPDYTSVSPASVFEGPNTDHSSTNSRVRSEDNMLRLPVFFEVHDTGIGVSPEKLQDIFTPFTQADASTSRVYGGTGLGLCIVERFVELLGGKLQADSELGKGSCFSFCVPLGCCPKDHEEKACETRDNMNGFSSAAAIPAEAKTSAEEKFCGGTRPPPNNEEEHIRSSSDPNVAYGQNLDSLGSRNSPEGSGGSDMATWSMKPRRSVENLDVLLANWNRNDSRLKGRACECACSLQNQEYKCCEPLCCSAKPRAPQQLGTPQQGPDVSVVSSSPPQQTFSSATPPWTRQSPPCSIPIPPSGSSTVDLDISSNFLRQDVACNLVETSQPLGFPPQSGRPAPVPTSPARSNAPPPARVDLPRKKDETTLNLRVLLAEDNLVNQKVASRQLQKHKHVVTVVGDGLQALETVKANHDSFDLVLMDVQMPNMDGLEATRRIREYESQQGWSRVPVLGLTAHAIQGYEDTCLKSGMDGYLGKPFDIDQLLRVIDRYVPPKDAIFSRR